MKNWNLFKLRLEWGFRLFAVGLGSIISGLGLFIFYLLISGYRRFYYKAELSVIKLSDLGDLIISISFVIILPILISTFILVVTRKFKELNQLIEENKKL